MSQLPVLDRRILENLGTELDNQAGALQFAGMFVDMLPQRIGAVEAAFAEQDAGAAVVALLSLSASASMVGARRLEEASSSAVAFLDDPATHGTLIARLRALSMECQSVLGGIIR